MIPETVQPIAELAAKIRADLAEGERLADQHNVELGPYDELDHNDVLALLAVVDAVIELPERAQQLDQQAAHLNDVPKSTCLAEAAGIRTAVGHLGTALAGARRD